MFCYNYNFNVPLPPLTPMVTNAVGLERPVHYMQLKRGSSTMLLMSTWSQIAWKPGNEVTLTEKPGNEHVHGILVMKPYVGTTEVAN